MNRYRGGVKPFAALLAVLLLAGCTTTATEPAPDPTPTTETREDAARTPAEACDSPALEGADGGWLRAADSWFETGSLGTGSTVAILVPQAEADYCGFVPYALQLAANGVRSILLNPCGAGFTECASGADVVTTGVAAVSAAATAAKADGATRVVLIGASMGGTIAVASAEACGFECPFDALASLSGPLVYEGYDTLPDAFIIALPMFLAVSADDTVVTAEQLTQLASGSASQQVGIYTGSGHGWAQLFDADGAPTTVAEQLTAFVTG